MEKKHFRVHGTDKIESEISCVLNELVNNISEEEICNLELDEKKDLEFVSKIDLRMYSVMNDFYI